MFDPPALVAVRLMLQFPNPNVCDGFLVSLNLNHVLFPGVRFLAPHAHEIGVFVDESVNVTESGAVPERGVPEKLATGAGGAVTVM
jgi:hypothetical protein